MAKALSKNAEADQWTESAQKIRGLILSRLYVPEDAAFYDLDAQNRFVKIRLKFSLAFGANMSLTKRFLTIFGHGRSTAPMHSGRHPSAIGCDRRPTLSPPNPAIHGVEHRRPSPLCRQAAGAITTPLPEFSVMMDRWCEAIQRDMTFRQQVDPLTGFFTREDAPNFAMRAGNGGLHHGGSPEYAETRTHCTGIFAPAIPQRI